MIYTLSWTTKKHQTTLFQATTFKAEENSRTFQGQGAPKPQSDDCPGEEEI